MLVHVHVFQHRAEPAGVLTSCGLRGVRCVRQDTWVCCSMSTFSSTVPNLHVGAYELAGMWIKACGASGAQGYACGGSRSTLRSTDAKLHAH